MKLQGSVMKVGNSLTITIPKAVCGNYNIKKGDTITFLTTDKGVFIPLKPVKLESLKDIIGALR